MSSPTNAAETGSPKSGLDPNPPTTASFSPSKISLANRQRSTILMQQKSPLLVATPPQITRALAFSHPFILPLNKLVGLISWSSGDPWESFLLVAGFWATVLYGGVATRWAGPPVVVITLILGMYSRRYSPLSSTGWTGEKVKGHKKQESEGSMRHSKSLDEIVETLNIFTSRCNILLDPLLQLTDFLSTQRTATSATTRPALTILFLRILLLSPVWIILALPSLQILTTRRIVLTSGTLILSWHSRPARVSRTILWRSLTIRKLLSFATGLTFMEVPPLPPRKAAPPPLPPRHTSQQDIANSLATDEKKTLVGLRFTFVIYENQRRWLGLGWTTSMFAYERAAWTDEHLNPSPPKDEFELPLVENENAAWQWVSNSDWRVDGAGKTASGPSGKVVSEGWIYYDNKWNDGRRQDGWGRYTRRRKWYRDAELVEITTGVAVIPIKPALDNHSTLNTSAKQEGKAISTSSNTVQSPKGSTSSSSSSQARRRGHLRRGSNTSGKSSNYSNKINVGSDDETDYHKTQSRPERNEDWGIGDDMKMGLG